MKYENAHTNYLLGIIKNEVHWINDKDWKLILPGLTSYLESIKKELYKKDFESIKSVLRTKANTLYVNLYVPCFYS